MKKLSSKISLAPPLYKCIAVLFASVIVTFALVSCGVLGGDTPEGYGNVRVSFGGSERNVTQADKDSATIRVYFNGEPIERKDGVFEKLVAVGTRLTVTAEAVATDGRVIGKGEENIIVRSNTNNVQMRIFTYDNFVVTVDGKATGYTDFVEAWNAANGKTATIKMNADAIASYTGSTGPNLISAITSGSLTLDLNGHTLADDPSTSPIANLLVAGTGTFILKDSSSGGKITGSTNGVMLTTRDASFIMQGGTLHAVSCSGTFTMSGGAIHAGVSVSGTFTMSGGTIIGNDFTGSGAGVSVKGTFNMSGGTISGKVASSYGGGVYVDSTGNFTMSGGVISGNTARAGNPDGDGGGVYVKSGGTFTQNGGSVTGNSPDDVIRANY